MFATQGLDAFKHDKHSTGKEPKYSIKPGF